MVNFDDLVVDFEGDLVGHGVGSADFAGADGDGRE